MHCISMFVYTSSNILHKPRVQTFPISLADLPALPAEAMDTQDQDASILNISSPSSSDTSGISSA